MTDHTNIDELRSQLSEPVTTIMIHCPKTEKLVGWIQINGKGKMILSTLSDRVELLGWVKHDDKDNTVLFTPPDLEQQNNS